jgi:hypothetical protein
MLFMVIETFRNGDPAPVGERFKQRGRMLPKDVVCHASWIDPLAARCYQLMEAERREALEPWTRAWEDLVAFEIIPVLTSEAYWMAR